MQESKLGLDTSICYLGQMALEFSLLLSASRDITRRISLSGGVERQIILYKIVD